MFHSTTLTLVASAAGHGMMTFPPSRQGGTLEKGGSHSDGTESWYTSGTLHPGRATNTDDYMETVPKMERLTMSANPWRAPGRARIQSPCGSGYTDASNDGRDLPPSEKTVWHQGSTAKVAWAVNQNHGGGYSFRLCPASSELTEECFKQNALTYVDDTTTIHWTDGREQTIPAHRKIFDGVQWTRNPIPSWEVGALPFKPPCKDCWGDFNDFSLVDEVTVPTNLAPGDYVLSWRWDTEVTPQSWQNCADITIVAASDASVIV